MTTCGAAFCQACGDCLACYGEDPCYENAGGQHSSPDPAVVAEEWCEPDGCAAAGEREE